MSSAIDRIFYIRKLYKKSDIQYDKKIFLKADLDKIFYGALTSFLIGKNISECFTVLHGNKTVFEVACLGLPTEYLLSLLKWIMEARQSNVIFDLNMSEHIKCLILSCIELIYEYEKMNPSLALDLLENLSTNWGHENYNWLQFFPGIIAEIFDKIITLYSPESVIQSPHLDVEMFMNGYVFLHMQDRFLRFYEQNKEIFGERFNTFIKQALRQNRTSFIDKIFEKLSEEERHDMIMSNLNDQSFDTIRSFSQNAWLAKNYAKLPEKTQIAILFEMKGNGSGEVRYFNKIMGWDKSHYPVSQYKLEEIFIAKASPPVKRAWLKEKAYKYAVVSRVHKFEVTEEGEDLKGDALKAKILNLFDDALRQCKDLDAIDACMERIKSNPHYATLKTGQDSFTRYFSKDTNCFARFFMTKETSSIKALKTLEAHHRARVETKQGPFVFY